jgi:hypothetical protein
MGRRTTGAVEVNHTLCLGHRSEELGAPFGLIVGGLVANFDFHLVGLFGMLYLRRSGGHPVPPLCHLSDCPPAALRGF